MKVVKWIFIILVLISFNFLVTEYLLRVNGIIENIHETKLGNELKNADRIFDFSPKMESRLLELQLGEKFDLDSKEKEKRISFAKVENYNPYPPIRHPFTSDYVIYRKDSVVKQITILSGESDTTPSVLVKKVRGKQTSWGDYFVTYIFYHNCFDIGNGNIDTDYNDIDWYSFRGGSYNGFEEAWIIVFTFFQIIILVIWLYLKKRKTSKNTYIAS
ncbi:hypothetical protein EYD45_14380 [Hyunsoonleella flava]|uniref:Uncharacterized protein n=1 Tax=Hyunsoonleella flava TaxID=2527939 RepID=A0A4Q9FE01_9FLAO|nr:hypothetical protein [Hyunsoonleella flava]TBN00451.1 hypothetical protein EYD45_14380 [Hyunsoonleella flava]